MKRALDGSSLVAAALLAGGCVVFGVDTDDYSLGSGSGGAGGEATGAGASGGAGAAAGATTGGGGEGGAPAPTCDDDEKNAAETDVDCGGTLCGPCNDGASCGAPGDCASHVCSGGVCAIPTCDDGVQNEGETLTIDCGGTCPCATGQPCGGNADCASKSCVDSVCAAASCNDAILNGSESDTDCGGLCPDRCQVGGACNADDDCSSAVCSGNICQAPSCNDGVANGSETAIDCGGACPSRCADGEGCAGANDCISGVCGQAGLCVSAACGDGVKNGGETDVDCGGPCGATCATSETCSSGADCLEAVCANAVCQAPTCSDGAANGAETDVDCGGGCPGCNAGGDCAVPGDCASSVCVLSVCQAPTCSDAVKNGFESDLDCGGPLCAACPNGKTCSGGGDCVSGSCNSGQCGPWILRSTGPFYDDSPTSSLSVASTGQLVLTGLTQSDGTSMLGFAPLTAAGQAGYNSFHVITSAAGAPAALHAFAAVPSASASDHAGRYAVVGRFSGAIDLGPVQLTSAPGVTDGFLIVFDLAGNPLWGRSLPRDSFTNASAVGFFPNGDVLVATIGNGAVYNVPGEPGYLGDIGVGRYASANGAEVWSRVFPASTNEGDLARAVTVDPSGDVVLAGEYGVYGGGTLDFGAGALLPAGGTRQGFVAKLAGPTGDTVWARSAVCPNQTAFFGVTTDALGNVFAVGAARGATTLTGGPTASQTLGVGLGGEYDVLIARLDSAGTSTHTRIFGGIGYEYAFGAAVDGAGRVWIAGTAWSDAYNLGGPGLSGANEAKPFVASYLTSTLAHTSSRSFATAGPSEAHSVAIEASGSVVISGTQSGTLVVVPGESGAGEGSARVFMAGLGPNP